MTENQPEAPGKKQQPELTHEQSARLLEVRCPDCGETPAECYCGVKFRPRREQLVHNHGPAEGRGLGCPETRTPEGRLIGACLLQPAAVQFAEMMLGEPLQPWQRKVLTMTPGEFARQMDLYRGRRRGCARSSLNRCRR